MNSVLEETSGLVYEADTLVEIAKYYTERSPAALPQLPPDPAKATLGFVPQTLAQSPSPISTQHPPCRSSERHTLYPGSFFPVDLMSTC